MGISSQGITGWITDFNDKYFWSDFTDYVPTHAWLISLLYSQGQSLPLVRDKNAADGAVVCVRSEIAPSAPSSVTVTAGDGQVELAWTAPASDGASSITDYVVQYAFNIPGVGWTSWTTINDGSSTATSATVKELYNKDTASSYLEIMQPLVLSFFRMSKKDARPRPRAKTPRMLSVSPIN